jgi:hypothetical protein
MPAHLQEVPMSDANVKSCRSPLPLFGRQDLPAPPGTMAEGIDGQGVFTVTNEIS